MGLISFSRRNLFDLSKLNQEGSYGPKFEGSKDTFGLNFGGSNTLLISVVSSDQL